MKRSDFWFDLPEKQIAQTPVEPRDHSRLLLMNRTSGECSHHHFYDIVDLLQPGDLLFFNRDGDIHHVAMYLGDGYYIHAPHTGDVVRVTAMEDNMPSFAQRVLPTKPVALQVKAPTPDELLDEARMAAGIK